MAKRERLRIIAGSKIGAVFFKNEHTDDGRNPAPDMVNIPVITGFYTSQVVCHISSINSIS